MGRGDIKSRRGKISKGTFGVSRPHKKKVEEAPKTKTKTKKKK